MILSGTEKMKRYPWIEGSELMGIVSYGRVKASNGKPTYKVDPESKDRLQSIGWHEVGRGHSYMYVQKMED